MHSAGWWTSFSLLLIPVRRKCSNMMWWLIVYICVQSFTEFLLWLVFPKILQNLYLYKDLKLLCQTSRRTLPMTIIQLQGWNFDRVTHCLQKNMQCSLNSQPLFTVLHYLTTLCNWTYLTTIHSNSWDCPVPSSLSQLLPDTLPDLISDTRSALLRDSLWWEAGKEEGNNNSDLTENM